MVTTVNLKSVHGKEPIRGMITKTVKVLKEEHLDRFRIAKAQWKFYRVLLDGAMLQENATLENLSIPEGADLTVVLTSATAI